MLSPCWSGSISFSLGAETVAGSNIGLCWRRYFLDTKTFLQKVSYTRFLRGVRILYHYR